MVPSQTDNDIAKHVVRVASARWLGENPHPVDSKTIPWTALKAINARSLVEWYLRENSGSTDIQQSAQSPIDYLTFNGLMFEVKWKELNRITIAMADANIPFVVIKGMAAVLHYYRGTEEIRPMGDTDLLVSSDNMLKAVRVLESMGYSFNRRETGLHNNNVIEVSLESTIGVLTNSIDLHRLVHNSPLHWDVTQIALNEKNWQLKEGTAFVCKPVCLLWSICHRAKDQYALNIRELFDIRLHIETMDEADWQNCIGWIIDCKLQSPMVIIMCQLRTWFEPESEKFLARESTIYSMVNNSRLKKLSMVANNNKVGKKPKFLPAVFSNYIGVMVEPSLRRNALSSAFQYIYIRLKETVNKPSAR